MPEPPAEAALVAREHVVRVVADAEGDGVYLACDDCPWRNDGWANPTAEQVTVAAAKHAKASTDG